LLRWRHTELDIKKAQLRKKMSKIESKIKEEEVSLKRARDKFDSLI
jgi:hypothetical protein